MRRMRTSIHIPDDLEKKLTAYRQNRKQELGKLPFRDTAIIELLRSALAHVPIETPITDRLVDLEKRTKAIEQILTRQRIA